MKTFSILALGAALVLPLLLSAHAGARDSGLYAPTESSRSVVERRKKRVKGGSGCDDAEDVREHPECR